MSEELEAQVSDHSVARLGREEEARVGNRRSDENEANQDQRLLVQSGHPAAHANTTDRTLDQQRHGELDSGAREDEESGRGEDPAVRQG